MIRLYNALADARREGDPLKFASLSKHSDSSKLWPFRKYFPFSHERPRETRIQQSLAVEIECAKLYRLRTV